MKTRTRMSICCLLAVIGIALVLSILALASNTGTQPGYEATRLYQSQIELSTAIAAP